MACRRCVSSERPGAFADSFRLTAEKTLSTWVVFTVR
jgi:hypothetical protein